MQRLYEMFSTYRLYRSAGHGIIYSARIAYGCAFHQLPF